jgi:transposase-like protein
MGKKIPKNVKAASMRAYVADGKTLREVAVEFGINAESLRRWLGNKVRPRGRHLVGKTSNNPVMRKTEVVEMIQETRKPRVSKFSPTHNRANYRWNETENEILRDAVLSKMTITETVELLGRTRAAIMCQKSKLVETGFISENERFIPPTGIKRVRKPMVTVMSTPDVVAEVAQPVIVEKPIEVKVAEPVKPTSNIDLADLAKLVKEFGVNVTLNVTAEGMEVKMTN